jgi:hypothetical protein
MSGRGWWSRLGWGRGSCLLSRYSRHVHSALGTEGLMAKMDGGGNDEGKGIRRKRDMHFIRRSRRTEPS